MTVKKSAPKFEPYPEPKGIGSIEGFERMIRRLRDAHSAGDLAAATVHALAAPRVLLDTDGKAWTVGLKSGKWYAFSGGRWHKHKQAPDPETIVRPERVRKGCHMCGTPIETEEPCPKCGAEPAPVLEDQTDAVRQGLVDFVAKVKYPMVPETLKDKKRKS